MKMSDVCWNFRDFACEIFLFASVPSFPCFCATILALGFAILLGFNCTQELHRGALTFWAQHEGHVWLGLLLAGVATAVPLSWHSWREFEIGTHQAAVGHALTVQRLLLDTLYIAEQEHARWSTLAGQSQEGVGAHARFMELERASYKQLESLRQRVSQCDTTVQCLRLMPLRQMAWNVGMPFDMLNILDGAAYIVEWVSYYLGVQVTAPAKPAALPVPQSVSGEAADALLSSPSPRVQRHDVPDIGLPSHSPTKGDSMLPGAPGGPFHASVLLDDRKTAVLRELDGCEDDACAGNAMHGEAVIFRNLPASTRAWSFADADGQQPCTYIRWWSACSVSELLDDESMRTGSHEPSHVLARDTAYVVVTDSVRGYAEDAAGGAIVHSIEEWLHYLGEYLELFADDVDVG